MREGWESEILKKVTVFKSGKTISKDIEKDVGEILYVKVGDMNLAGNEEYITTSTRFVDPSDINENQIITIGSTIFPKRGGAIATNKKRRIIKPTIVDLNTMAVGPSDRLCSEYLYYWFQSVDLKELSNGTSIPQINNISFDAVYITFPVSIPEQKQIVALLDQAFEAIDQAKANIEQNIQNAKELFQSKLNDIFSQKGDGWEEKTLGEVCKLINGGTPKTNIKEYWDGDIQWITPADMGKLKSKNVQNTRRQITDLGLNKSSAKLFPKDSIILSTRAPIGHLAINSVEMATNQGCRGIIPKTDISTLFLYYFLFISTKLLNDLGTGTTFKELSTKALSSVAINIPSFERQKIEAQKMESLEKLTEKIVINYTKQLHDLAELKKSILEKAFAGELTEKEIMV